MRLPVLSSLCLATLACTQAPAEPTYTAGEQPPPIAGPSTASSGEDDIRHFLLQEYPDAAPMRYALAWNDLDGDGADEAIVHLVAPYFCGTGGCNTLVLTQAGPMLRKVGDISVSRTPISVLDSKTNGWDDLVVSISGGGGPSGRMVLKYDGRSYPSNPTVAPATPTDEVGTELISEDPEMVELAATTSD